MQDYTTEIAEQMTLALQNLGAKPEDLAVKRSPTDMLELMRSLGAKSDLLGLVGSYGDTMEDEDVLRALRKWNEQKSAERGVP